MGKTVILMVVLFTVVVSTMFIAINKQQIKLSDNLAGDYDIQQARLLSQSGIYYAATKTSHIQYSQLNKKNINNVVNSTRDIYLKRLNELQYQLKSIATVYSSRCSTYAIIRKMPYSEYTLFVNSFPTNSYFGNGEVFNGPLYVDGNLGVGQVPGAIFYDDVYCTGTVKYYAGATKSNFKGFKGNITQKFEKLNMPQDRTKLGLSDDINTAYNIDNIKDIELNNNKIILTNKSNVKTTIQIDKLESPLLYKTKNEPLNIKGVIDRQLTIGTQGVINIVDNILYKDIKVNKQTLLYELNQQSSSMLALMTTQDIIIHKDANKATLNTTYDVVVCASLFTTKSIIVNQKDFQWLKDNSKSSSKKIRKFIVYGSRTQNVMDNKTYDPAGQYGLAQSILYDPRMKFKVPIGMTAPERSIKILDWYQVNSLVN